MDDGELLIYEWERRLYESDWWVDALACHLSAYAFFLQAAKAIWCVMLKNNSLRCIAVARNPQYVVMQYCSKHTNQAS